MYKKILVTLDGTATDRAVIEHVKELARFVQGRVVLLHVADGWAARSYGADAVSREIAEDTAYLNQTREELQAAGIAAETDLAYGDPSREIVRWVEQQGCDLIAMSTHGHKIIGDFFLGSTINKVRHNTTVPILVVRAKSGSGGPFAK